MCCSIVKHWLDKCKCTRRVRTAVPTVTHQSALLQEVSETSTPPTRSAFDAEAKPTCSKCDDPSKINSTDTYTKGSHCQTGSLNVTSIKLDIVLMSGAVLAHLSVGSDWTSKDIKAALKPSIKPATTVTALVFGSDVMENASVADMGLSDGCVLQAIVQQCDFLVEGAGVEKVNGCYLKTERLLTSYPVYVNEHQVILFKYCLPSGKYFWYFSEDGNLANSTDSTGDYYRALCTSCHPPHNGWEYEHCPRGEYTNTPTVNRLEEDVQADLETK